jgi:hypothetical protein
VPEMKIDFNDPLSQIIETHIFQTPVPTESMVSLIVDEYIAYLKDKGIYIPHSLKEIFIGDLKDEVRQVTFKKTYGQVKIGS